MNQKPGMKFETLRAGCIIIIAIVGAVAMIWQGHWWLLVGWIPFCYLFLRGPDNGL